VVTRVSVASGDDARLPPSFSHSWSSALCACFSLWGLRRSSEAKAHSAKVSSSPHSGQPLALVRSLRTHPAAGRVNIPSQHLDCSLVAAAIAVGAVAHIDNPPCKGTCPGHTTGALDEAHDAASQDQCAPTMPAPLPRRRNCRPREGGFTAICECRGNVIPSVSCWLPDSQPLPRRRSFPHQLELEDAVVVCGLARRLVQLHR
jgi:hypothetical protein